MEKYLAAGLHQEEGHGARRAGAFEKGSIP
jgi:hypothetical protein